MGTLEKFCPQSWLIYMIIIIVLSLLWVGYECDRLTKKLTVDEYMLPVILVWADVMLLISVFVLIAICLLAGGGIDSVGAGFCYCDCSGLWIHSWAASTQ